MTISRASILLYLRKDTYGRSWYYAAQKCNDKSPLKSTMLTGNISEISRRILNQQFLHATMPRCSQSTVAPLNNSNLSSPLIKEVKIRPSGYPLAEWYRDNNIEPTNVGGWYIPEEGDPGYDTFLRRIEETAKENAEIRSKIQAEQAAKKKISF